MDFRTFVNFTMGGRVLCLANSSRYEDESDKSNSIEWLRLDIEKEGVGL